MEKYTNVRRWRRQGENQQPRAGFRSKVFGALGRLGGLTPLGARYRGRDMTDEEKRQAQLRINEGGEAVMDQGELRSGQRRRNRIYQGPDSCADAKLQGTERIQVTKFEGPDLRPVVSYLEGDKPNRGER